MRLKKTAENEAAKKVFDSIDKEKLANAAKKDCEYYAKEFAYETDGNWDYVDDDEPKNLVDEFNDYMHNNDCEASDVFEIIVEAIEDSNLEYSDGLVKDIVSLIGYDAIGDYICDEGWDNDIEKILSSAEVDLVEYIKDQKMQQEETERMKWQSYYW